MEYGRLNFFPEHDHSVEDYSSIGLFGTEKAMQRILMCSQLCSWGCLLSVMFDA